MLYPREVVTGVTFHLLQNDQSKKFFQIQLPVNSPIKPGRIGVGLLLDLLTLLLLPSSICNLYIL